MSFFDKVFGRKVQENQTTTMFKMFNDAGNGFYSWDGQLFKSDIVRSCIRPTAKAVGKLEAQHIRNYNDQFVVNPNLHIRFLLEEPNPLMSMQQFQEKMTYQLELNNNAFAYIKRDEIGTPLEIYPIPCTCVEVIEGMHNDIFLKFMFENGKKMTVPYADIIHLRQDFNSNDVLADNPIDALKNLMEVVSTVDQGIIKAVQSSNTIKWLLKFKQVLKKDDIKREVDDFISNYLTIDSAASGGAVGTDPKYDLEQVKSESYVPNSEQMAETTKRIYSFFNVNEDIIQSKFSEDIWNAFYESKIEVIARQLSNEFTRKLFTRKERSFGNKIIFQSSSLQYASMSTKMNLVQMVDRGALTPNEWREILNLPPVEGGEKPLRRLDTAVVNETLTEGGENDGSTQLNNEN